MDKNRCAGHGPVAEHGPVGGDTRDTQTRAELVGGGVRQVDGKVVIHGDVLRGGAEGTIGLGAVDPHAPPNAVRIDALADLVDDPGGVAVRDHTRVGHCRPQPTAAFLRVAWVHPRVPNPDPDLARRRLRVGQLTDLQDLLGRSLLVVPGNAHRAQLLGRTSQSWCPSRRRLLSRDDGQHADEMGMKLVEEIGQELLGRLVPHLAIIGEDIRRELDVGLR